MKTLYTEMSRDFVVDLWNSFGKIYKPSRVKERHWGSLEAEAPRMLDGAALPLGQMVGA